jgi:hypothetical protein
MKFSTLKVGDRFRIGYDQFTVYEKLPDEKAIAVDKWPFVCPPEATHFAHDAEVVGPMPLDELLNSKTFSTTLTAAEMTQVKEEIVQIRAAFSKCVQAMALMRSMIRSGEDFTPQSTEEVDRAFAAALASRI